MDTAAGKKNAGPCWILYTVGLAFRAMPVSLCSNTHGSFSPRCIFQLLRCMVVRVMNRQRQALLRVSHIIGRNFLPFLPPRSIAQLMWMNRRSVLRHSLSTCSICQRVVTRVRGSRTGARLDYAVATKTMTCKKFGSSDFAYIIKKPSLSFGTH